MELKFQVQGRIAKPVDDVFDAVYNPEKHGTSPTSRVGAVPVYARKVEPGRSTTAAPPTCGRLA
jgi:hypothetical protein